MAKITVVPIQLGPSDMRLSVFSATSQLLNGHNHWPFIIPFPTPYWTDTRRRLNRRAHSKKSVQVRTTVWLGYKSDSTFQALRMGRSILSRHYSGRHRGLHLCHPSKNSLQRASRRIQRMRVGRRGINRELVLDIVILRCSIPQWRSRALGTG